MKTFTLLFVTALTAVAANCSPFDPNLGAAPYLCTAAQPDCPEGYICQATGSPAPMDMACLKQGGTLPDAGSGGGFLCADDSAVEGVGGGRNDTIATAFVTPVATQMPSISLAGLAICPEGDKDNYQINIVTANQNLEVISSWESGMPVNVSILNAGGTSIGNGTAMGDKAFRVCLPNLPVGMYFASAFAAATIKNNYKLSIKVVTSCI